MPERHAMIPDYSAGGLGDTAGYYLSAIIGGSSPNRAVKSNIGINKSRNKILG